MKRDVQQQVQQQAQQQTPQQPDTFHKIQEDVEHFFENAKDKVSEIFDPENVKKGFGVAVDKVHEVVSI